MKFVFSFDASQLAGSELKDKDEEVGVKFQRPQGSGKTVAVEENEHVSLSYQKLFIVFMIL